MAKPILRFRLHPFYKGKPSSLYYDVFVSENRDEMWNHSARMLPGTLMRKGDMAAVHGMGEQHFRNGRWVMGKRIGMMHFNKTDLGMSVISHECVHAAMFFLRRKLRKQTLVFINPAGQLVTDVEEDLCIATGRLGAEIVTRFCKAGFYE